MNEITINVPTPKLNVDVVGETDEYQVELKQTGGLCELIVYSGQNISGESGDGFNPALDYLITGFWTFSQTINTTPDGDSSLWKLGYDHSLITTGNPHMLDLADIGESYASINYWTLDGGNLYRSSGNITIGSSASVCPLYVYQNNSSTGTDAGITIEQDGTGDALLQYILTGSRRWVTGVDNSDSDKFKIANSTDLSGDVALTITESRYVGIGTTNPFALFSVQGGDVMLTLDRPDDPYSGDLRNPGLYIDFTNGRASVFGSKVYVPYSLGLGIDGPLYKLHIKDDGNFDTICKIENLTNTGRSYFQADSRLGTAYLGSLGDSYSAVPDWANSGILGADSTLTGGMVIYNASSSGIRFQNVAGTDLFSIYGGNPRFHVSTFFENRAGTDQFASGFAGNGWEVKDYTISGPARYTSTFDNLVVRRTMKVYELEINKIRASNGSLWVSDAMEAEYAEDLGTSYKIKVLDELDMPFLVDDIVRTQSWTGSGIKFWQGKVLSTGTELISGETYGWAEVEEYPAGSGYTDSPENGDVFVRVDYVGITYPQRKGAIYLTSSDTGSPFIDVVYGMETEAMGVKVRLGKLDGITDTDAGLDGSQTNYWGLYSDNVHLKGHIFAQTGDIGGWELASNKLWSGTDWNDGAAIDAGMEMDSSALRMVNFRDGSNYVRIWNTNDTDWGIEGVVASNKIFELGDTNQIAGWSFNDEAIYNSIDSTYVAIGYPQQWSSSWYGFHVGLDINNKIFIGAVGTSYTLACTDVGATVFQLGSTINQIAGWEFDSNKLYNSNIEINNSTSTIKVSKDASNYVQMNYTGISDWGMSGLLSGSKIFQLGDTNQIAGWEFNDTILSSSNDRIVIDSGNNSITAFASDDPADGSVSIYYNSSLDWGLSGVDDSYNVIFQLGDTNQIAGWEFNDSKIFNSNIQLDNTNSNIDFNAGGNIRFFNSGFTGTVLGNIYTTGGNLVLEPAATATDASSGWVYLKGLSSFEKGVYYEVSSSSITLTNGVNNPVRGSWNSYQKVTSSSTISVTAISFLNATITGESYLLYNAGSYTINFNTGYGGGGRMKNSISLASGQTMRMTFNPALSWVLELIA